MHSLESQQNTVFTFFMKGIPQDSSVKSYFLNSFLIIPRKIVLLPVDQLKIKTIKNLGNFNLKDGKRRVVRKGIVINSAKRDKSLVICVCM